MKNFLNILILSVVIFISAFSFVSAENKVDIYVFGRENCNFCHLEKTFLDAQLSKRNDFNFIELDVNNSKIKKQFDLLTDKYHLIKATPITLVGDFIIQGFNSDETTGQDILLAIDEHKGKANFSIEEYLVGRKNLATSGAICSGESSKSCLVKVKQRTEIKVPFLGIVDFKEFSLLSMSIILGFVDGFNPCAMWVLLTFLLILWQLGNKKKMFQAAGLFIFAETIMYWAILNFWFGAWDFIGLDRIVTPTVGVIAIVGGIYFLQRYFKHRNELVCDVASYKSKSKTEQKIKELIKSPMAILTVLGIISVAFSVNIIEFACSVGIPQAFTKILEINHLSTFSEQMYILIYTFFYMIDDFVVFGLALYGFDKFYTVGQKYSNLSSLIGGILMLILGALLLFAPGTLIFQKIAVVLIYYEKI